MSMESWAFLMTIFPTFLISSHTIVLSPANSFPRDARPLSTWTVALGRGGTTVLSVKRTAIVGLADPISFCVTVCGPAPSPSTLCSTTPPKYPNFTPLILILPDSSGTPLMVILKCSSRGGMMKEDGKVRNLLEDITSTWSTEIGIRRIFVILMVKSMGSPSTSMTFTALFVFDFDSGAKTNTFFLPSSLISRGCNSRGGDWSSSCKIWMIPTEGSEASFVALFRVSYLRDRSSCEGVSKYCWEGRSNIS
mmetsp:Transcript_27323/g.66456  ORF Transcript_27323/g.66456 Transcript_27323/m.66456 type:complete len:250 (+) Transcript_27323:1221-1970(+)